MARTLRTAWQSVAWQGLAPLRYPTPHLPSSQRLLNIWDIFNKEALARNRLKLEDEVNRSYAQEIKEMKDHKGKVVQAQTLARLQAEPWPRTDTMDVSGNAMQLPPTHDDGTVRAALICTLFRANAQEMVHKWTDAFAASMAGEQGVHVYQLSVVENTVMSMPGFRNMLLAGGRELERQAAARLAATGVTGAASALPLRVNYSFGDSYTLRSALRIQTRLTTYVHLVDSDGKVRFVASGEPTPKELKELVVCAQQLLKDTPAAATQLE